MSLDFPAFASAWWSRFDAGQLPRPEYGLPVLFTESGFQSVQNFAGAPYYGINQAAGSYLEARGIDPQDYLTWAASAQLSSVVAPMWGATIAKYGALKSGTSVYLANFLPARLAGSRSLSTVLASKGDGSQVYESNYGLDFARKGTITIGDLAQAVKNAAGKGVVRDAIAQVYAARPGESPSDPVWGTEYLWQRAKPAAIVGGALAGLGLALHALSKGAR